MWGHEGCIPEQSEPLRAIGGRLCSNKEVMCSLVYTGECDWLSQIILQAVRAAQAIKLMTRQMATVQPREGISLWRDFCLRHGAYLVTAGGPRVRPSEPCDAKDGKAAHGILDFTIQPRILALLLVSRSLRGTRKVLFFCFFPNQHLNNTLLAPKVRQPSLLLHRVLAKCDMGLL